METKESWKGRIDVSERAWKLLNILIPLLVTINMAITGYILKQFGDLALATHAIDKRVTAIEANRFTSKDANELMRSLLSIEKELAQFPKEIPPAWFLERVKNLEHRMDKLEGH